MAAELVELSAVIADIYDAAIDPALWQHTLARICAYVGAFQGALFWHDAAAQDSQRDRRAADGRGTGWLACSHPATDIRRRTAAGEANGAVAAVFVSRIEPNAPPPLEMIAAQYELSAAETQVLNALVQVRGIRAMAEMLGLSQNTVKSHLANLFRKTGTRRQGDLARLVPGR